MVDFPVAEFATRCKKAQILMAKHDFDALFFCTEAEIRYFSGFRTLFWQSPTRPWYLVIPQDGLPIAIIPNIGVDLMRQTWVRDIRSWSSPHPNDEGINLLQDVLRPFTRVGVMMSYESRLGMPLVDFQRLHQRVHFVDCAPLVKQVRMIKSTAEIQRIADICHIASNSFARVHEFITAGDSLDTVFRRFKIALLQDGAEDVPYLVGGAGKGGYHNVISPPTQQRLQIGDVLMLDTGTTLAGYFCDFNRNFAIGGADMNMQDAHKKLWQALQAGLQTVRAGVSCADVFHAMQAQLNNGSSLCHSEVGRYGHGLGMQLTEHPSLAAFDQTMLQTGMVITLEPSLTLPNGKMMVLEENIVIDQNEARLLTKPSPPELMEIL